MAAFEEFVHVEHLRQLYRSNNLPASYAAFTQFAPEPRAVDDEGEVLDLLVQRRRDKAAAVKLMRKLLKKQGFAPDVLVTDKLRSYGAAKSEIGLSARHDQGLRANNRAENSHQPTGPTPHVANANRSPSRRIEKCRSTWRSQRGDPKSFSLVVRR